MRIAAFYDTSANSHYRAKLPLQALAKRGHAVEAFVNGHVDAPACDLAYIYRFAGEQQLAMARALRARGVAVVYDLDDNLTDWVGRGFKLRGRNRRREVRGFYEDTVAIARTAHLMTTPSRALAEQYRGEGVEHVSVIENHLPDVRRDQARTRHAGIVIGSVAGQEHDNDFRQLRLRQVLTELLERFPHVRVATVGVDLSLRHPRYSYNVWIAIEQLIEYERSFDVGFAALVDNPFNRSRSNVKLKEYAAAGVPWLASPVGPYAAMGEAQGGELVGDGDWLEAFCRLIEDFPRRRQLAANARRWAAGETISSAATQWEKAFRAAVARARKAPAPAS